MVFLFTVIPWQQFSACYVGRRAHGCTMPTHFWQFFEKTVCGKHAHSLRLACCVGQAKLQSMFGFWGEGFWSFFPVVFEQKRGKGRAACLTEDSAYTIESRCKQCLAHRVHTEWQWPLSGDHSIMMVKSAQPGEGEGCTPSLFHCVYHREQNSGASCERRYTPPISSLPLYVLCGLAGTLYIRCPMEINKGKLALYFNIEVVSSVGVVWLMFYVIL